MVNKDFKTIDEQLEILRSRGLSITDDAKAKDFCSTIITIASVVTL